MTIVGCDFHPSFQQVAILDDQTGEERVLRLDHPEPARRFYQQLRGEGVRTENGWNRALATDYKNLRFHISFWEAAGRRLRRNYLWIFATQGLSYLAKILIHPTAVPSLDDLWARAAVGPIPGQAVLLFGLFFHSSLALFALVTLRRQQAAGRVQGPDEQGDPMLLFDLKA